MNEELKCGDISGERERTYRIYEHETNTIHEIVIDKPVKLFYYKNGDHTFHRIFDGVSVHLAPVPGFIRDDCGKVIGYCEVSWIPNNPEEPVKF